VGDELIDELARHLAAAAPTHASMMAAHDATGVVATACNEPLVTVWFRPDDVAGSVHVVALFACPACRAAVSVDWTARKILNVYPLDHAGRNGLAQALAVDQAGAAGRNGG
jgi:hypothetical protein